MPNDRRRARLLTINWALYFGIVELVDGLPRIVTKSVSIIDRAKCQLSRTICGNWRERKLNDGYIALYYIGDDEPTLGEM